ncbi:adenylate/guanylate cyclase domain-containing protein [Mesorhizobium sp. LHD-90]|uniref:adenylate/guanylate cyclase domain-containing protein n=1 Tax=Mesorhizobium sp. LHD-90 TaxID=3071414 RepID=UPI0027E06C9F|nr:adenylate/guanylate cyclase domain-containing protein [Mesorhizobium sp. LHD-90]MDQ6436555.1 adenylate/guanylate cyclase domain-containing protein [Mesorhizobium sp. LHD-90]
MNIPTQPVRLQRPPEKRRRIPVSIIMALSFGTLVLLSVGGVLALTVSANYRNTFDLLGAQSTLLVDAMEDSLRTEMARPESAVDGIAQLYTQGEFQIDDEDATAAALSGALSATTQATAMLICTPDMVCRGVSRRRDSDPPGEIQRFAPEAETSPQTLAALEQRRRVDGRRWGAFVSNQYGLFAQVSVPLSRNGATHGWVIAAVELHKLSDITQQLSTRFGTHAFILDGDDRVLADPRLADPAGPKGAITPLMPLAAFGDPVLAAYPERKAEEQFDARRTRDVELAEIDLDGDKDTSNWWNDEASYFAMTRKIAGYGERPWTIGAYFKSSQIAGEIERVVASALVGLGAMAAAVIIAILLGRRLSRPIQAIAGQATRVADFELDGLAPLPRSRVLEIDDQASAFNAMLIGLRAFSTYIPRSLVAKLVRSGEIGIVESREAMVTVMFTDIADFTALSERMGAAEAAKLLNRHFAILCRAVDAEGGTVDKFLGDGMMAFFGAPDHLKGHAAAAVRAAAVIRDELEADNRSAATEGRPALRVRIGIHTGPVIVGNIGASDRVNYTIIGDTVNVSQRLQELGKVLAPEARTTIAISAETASRLDERFETIPAGTHRLRGRGEAMAVFVVGEVHAGAPSSETHEASAA